MLMVTMTGRPQRALNISVGVRRRGLRASGLLPALLDLLHRTLAFPLTPFRRGSPGNARVLAQEGIRRASRAPGVHAAAQAARGDVLPIFEWVMEDPEGLASSASSEFGRGVRGLGPGFYLRYPPVGAAHRITTLPTCLLHAL